VNPNQPLIDLRRRLLRESRTQLEKDRYAENIKARCGCTFVPWQKKEFKGFIRGVGLIQECDQSQRLCEVSLAAWETHTYFAREDAENRLEEIIRLIASGRLHVPRQ
jgi:hypothetical protein